ncbi:hypothetical protein GCM10017744_032860 [Streptomyces antimycoticus]
MLQQPLLGQPALGVRGQQAGEPGGLAGPWLVQPERLGQFGAPGGGVGRLQQPGGAVGEQFGEVAVEDVGGGRGLVRHGVAAAAQQPVGGRAARDQDDAECLVPGEVGAQPVQQRLDREVRLVGGEFEEIAMAPLGLLHAGRPMGEAGAGRGAEPERGTGLMRGAGPVREAGPVRNTGPVRDAGPERGAGHVWDAEPMRNAGPQPGDPATGQLGQLGEEGEPGPGAAGAGFAAQRQQARAPQMVAHRGITGDGPVEPPQPVQLLAGHRAFGERIRRRFGAQPGGADGDMQMGACLTRRAGAARLARPVQRVAPGDVQPPSPRLRRGVDVFRCAHRPPSFMPWPPLPAVVVMGCR